MMTSLKVEQAARMTVAGVAEACRTNLILGLTHEEAHNRLAIHGPNTFDISKDDPLWKKYLDQVSGEKLEPFVFKLPLRISVLVFLHCLVF